MLYKKVATQTTGTIKYFRYGNGSSYTGEVDGINREGQGRINYKNGNCFIGDFVKNRRHGKGLEVRPYKGEIYFGVFTNNRKNGWWFKASVDGNHQMVEYKNGKRVKKKKVEIKPSPSTDLGLNKTPLTSEKHTIHDVPNKPKTQITSGDKKKYLVRYFTLALLIILGIPISMYLLSEQTLENTKNRRLCLC